MVVVFLLLSGVDHFKFAYFSCKQIEVTIRYKGRGFSLGFSSYRICILIDRDPTKGF
jgi:hypothetical protein